MKKIYWFLAIIIFLLVPIIANFGGGSWALFIAIGLSLTVNFRYSKKSWFKWWGVGFIIFILDYVLIILIRNIIPEDFSKIQQSLNYDVALLFIIIPFILGSLVLSLIFSFVWKRIRKN